VNDVKEKRVGAKREGESVGGAIKKQSEM